MINDQFRKLLSVSFLVSSNRYPISNIVSRIPSDTASEKSVLNVLRFLNRCTIKSIILFKFYYYAY